MTWDWDNLTGKQLEQIHDALLSAFPRRDELARFLLFKMSVELDQIATGNYSNVVFEVVKWAKAKGRARELCRTALEQVPGSAKLRALGADSEVKVADEPRLAPAWVIIVLVAMGVAAATLIGLLVIFSGVTT